MKLKTEFQDEDFEKGEVTDVSIATMPDGRIFARAKAKKGGLHTFYYDSLVTLYNDWSDYEEPKGYWYYDTTCGRVEKLNHNADKEIDKILTKTKEDMERVLRKAKGGEK